jgi:hypothetical protein
MLGRLELVSGWETPLNFTGTEVIRLLALEGRGMKSCVAFKKIA